MKGGLFALLGGIAVALINVWRKPSSKAELETAIANAARGIVADLRDEVERLQGRVEGLEAENTACRGENRQLWQRIDSLEVVLRRNGITIPARELSGSLVVIEGERTTVFKPDTSKPAE